MAKKIRWSSPSVADIDEICKYISKDSQTYAFIFAQRIFAAAETIALFPYAGRMVPEKREENLREKILGNYRMIYRIKDDVIEIVTVIHGARILKL